MENELVIRTPVEEEMKHALIMAVAGTVAGFFAGKAASKLYSMAVEAYRDYQENNSEDE